MIVIQHKQTQLLVESVVFLSKGGERNVYLYRGKEGGASLHGSIEVAPGSDVDHLLSDAGFHQEPLIKETGR